jgi:hydrogenase maturation protease
MSIRARVAGVGNVFFGDDGFGVEVARRLAEHGLPRGIIVSDIGVRGIHLAFELLEPVDLLIVVDVAPRGGEPGTLYVIDPDFEPRSGAVSTDPHAMDLSVVFDAVVAMGAKLPPVRIVGCEPFDLEPGIGLSAVVAAAVEPAAELVRGLLEPWLEAPGADANEEEVMS